MEKNHRTAALVCGAVSNFILGFNFIIEKLIAQIEEVSPSPLIILAYECTVCVIVLSLLIPVFKPDFSKLKRLGFKKLYPLIGMAIFDPLLFYIGSNYALACGASPVYITIVVAVMPVLAMVTGIFVLKEIPTFLQVIFSLVSVGGVIAYTLITSNYSSEQAGVINLPVILFLLLTVASGVGYGMFTRISSTDLTSYERTYGCFFIAAVIIDVLAVVTNAGNLSALTEPLSCPRFLLLAAIFGTFPLALNYIIYNYAMNYLPVSQAMIFSGLSTVVTFVFTYILFEGERVATLPKLICIALVLIGVAGAEKFGRHD